MKKLQEFKLLFAAGVQSLLFDTLFIVSTLLSFMMFISFGNTPASKIIMGIVAIVFESTKLYDLLKCKQAYKNKNSAKVIFSGISYLVKATLSIIASVGFALVLLSAQRDLADISQDTLVLEATDYDSDIRFWEEKLNAVSLELKIIANKKADNPDGWGTAYDKLVKDGTTLESNQMTYKLNLDQAKAQKLSYQASIQAGEKDVVTNPADMFEELSLFINTIAKKDLITTQSLMTLIFMLIMLVLEISIATTSGELPEIKEKEVVTEVELAKPNPSLKEFYEKFIEGLYQEASSSRLNSTERASSNSELDFNVGKKLKKSLMSMTFKGKPLLIVKDRKTQSGLGKDNLIKVVNWLLDNPNDGMYVPELP